MTEEYSNNRPGAVILAAGLGTRLLPYTCTIPKGMLAFAGKSLLQHQIDTYRATNIENICIVRGYNSAKISFPDLTYFDNDDYAGTNMVYSLICARNFINSLDGLIVSYADIIFEQRLLNTLLESNGDIRVIVDLNWKELWKSRSDDWLNDVEELVFDNGNLITKIGASTKDPDLCMARYTGLLYFSKAGILSFVNTYDELVNKIKQSEPWRFSPSFKKAYMTCMIQELVDRKVDVRAVPVQGGWLEFDTKDDYERSLEWYQNGSLSRFIKLS